MIPFGLVACMCIDTEEAADRSFVCDFLEKGEHDRRLPRWSCGNEDAGSSSQDGGAICPCPLIPTGACIAAGSAPCFCPIEVACDAGTCQTYSPLPCGAIESCACADGTTQTAGCSGPPTCADACCAYGGVNP